MKKTIRAEKNHFNNFIHWMKKNNELHISFDHTKDCVNYHCNNQKVARVSFGSVNGVCIEKYEIEQEAELIYLNYEKNKQRIRAGRHLERESDIM